MRQSSIVGLCLVVAGTFVGIAEPVAAQTDIADLDVMASWVALDVATGYETRVAGDIAAEMPGWSADRWGNIVRQIGSGSPKRVVACGLDRPSYAVSQITDDGYIRVHRIGGGSRHPLWDQAFEAQQVRVLTRQGPVAGVVARSNGHFAPQHRDEVTPVTADDLWVDVGAESGRDVALMGINLLDPISRHLPPWTIAGGVAGPDAGRRLGCAAVATLADQFDAAEGETHFVLSSQQIFNWIGLSSYVAREGGFDEVILVGPGEATRTIEQRPPARFGRFRSVLEDMGMESVEWIAPRVTSPGSHMETMSAEEAQALLGAIADAAGISVPSAVRWTQAPPPRELRTDFMDASLDPVASVLTELVELHSIPGHEWSVRRYVLEALPEWARDLAVVDDIGNIMIDVGPSDTETTVFMAHMDEVGYEVESVAADGVVTLRRLGGAVSSAWEGQTALIHFDPPGAPSTKIGDGTNTDPQWKTASFSASAAESLKGVFLTRDDPVEKNPSGPMRAWFGLDAEGLRERGVGVGSAVTSHKEGLRLGRSRFVARGLDDRAGTTAMLLAINALDPDQLQSRVIFTWSVYEEGGLIGAGAMARRFGTATERIYSVDTFVSSDTPLEPPHFANTPLGSGPVLRVMDSAGVTPESERDRVYAIGEVEGIPLQTGVVQGSPDGAQFAYWGSASLGLSWPGRYSHTPGEVLDLRDLSQLADLVLAVAAAGE